jgi:hypothetical protein
MTDRDIHLRHREHLKWQQHAADDAESHHRDDQAPLRQLQELVAAGRQSARASG